VGVDISYVRRCRVDLDGMRLLMGSPIKAKKASAILETRKNSDILRDRKSRAYAPLDRLLAHMEVKGDPLYHVWLDEGKRGAQLTVNHTLSLTTSARSAREVRWCGGKVGKVRLRL
jgi:hypothetical protein